MALSKLLHQPTIHSITTSTTWHIGSMSLLSARPSICSCHNNPAVRFPWVRSVRRKGPDLRWQRSLSRGGVTFQNRVRPEARHLDPLSETRKVDNPSISTVSQASGTESQLHPINANSPNPAAESGEDPANDVRRPRAVQAIFLRPLKRKAEYGVPACDLQLRSYGPRNIEFFADFALRAAYYLGLPALGPIPLPKSTQRWTVPRSPFVHKTKEQFERITHRRLIQIQDANTEVVEIWLAFLRKHAYYGLGMKANVWQYEKLGVGKTMDVDLKNLRSSLDPAWAHFGRRKTMETSERAYQMIKGEKFGTSEKASDSAI